MAGGTWQDLTLQEDLIFAHTIFTKTQGILRDKEIWSQITMWMDLW